MAITYRWAVYQFEDEEVKERYTANTYRRCMKQLETLGDDSSVVLEAVNGEIDHGYALVENGIIEAVTNGENPRKVPVKFQSEINKYDPEVTAGKPKGEPSKTLSVRLKVATIEEHSIDGEWVSTAVDEKIERDK